MSADERLDADGSHSVACCCSQCLDASDRCQLCDHAWPNECVMAMCDCHHEAAEAEPGARATWASR